ncbi:cell division protein FtsL [Litorimonas sp. WD9-15]|uniref:cell division protein FtsL n=1 Tax=Litorimonas sp. WD9-15 TaxID=3418716 RepID=UPI003CFE2BB0
MSASYATTGRAARRMSWFLLFLVGVALTVTLYFVKTHAQSAKREVRQLTQSIAAEEAVIRVLRAELAYLQSPTRLSELNDEHLKLAPITPEQEREAADIIAMFPLVSELGEEVAP